MPRVIKLGITSTSAVFEPRTAATTTTAFVRFLDGTAFEAYGPDGGLCRHGRWCLHAGICHRNEQNKLSAVATYSSTYTSMQLTFAGLHAIGPSVIDIFTAKSSAVLEPSTARSATTDSA